ncbi:hypothetical protein F3Y22_tig00111769pilonHSYRG00366 [Hibiscus syriacus]|uniref:Uncharacterized protein n=1 Tax=Hibiscus syriacus TaxID=106335 RepID=A0A6A2XVT0_HIBSY|nr:hypothetical protein F3Y22_tig00111769pilonHSYRG00366 [Hibiscus syriacus]
MPKDARVRSASLNRSRASPYTCSSRDDVKLWDDAAICPICLEIPHNAVLLRCSSSNKGCRPKSMSRSFSALSVEVRFMAGRMHARSAHPNVRPTEVDLERRCDWTTFELESEHEDMLSSVQEFDSITFDLFTYILHIYRSYRSPISSIHA